LSDERGSALIPVISRRAAKDLTERTSLTSAPSVTLQMRRFMTGPSLLFFVLPQVLGDLDLAALFTP
jgi:hypothetical protein